jgi:fimbrial isopeptide formation D2 family protein
MKNSTTLPTPRFLQFIVISILLFSLALPKPALADVAAGISEYFIPGSADQLRAILVDNDNDLTDNNLHFVITVPVSTNNVRVYFDHWENGYGTGATGYDESYTPTKGQVLTFESPTVPANPRGSTLAACAGSSNPSGSTSNCYDGRDRIYIEGGAVAVAAAFWPSTTGSVYANAWEVYPTKPDQTSYTIPVGEDLFALGTYYADFDNVYVLVQALVDGTIVNVNNPTGADLTNVALSRGQVTQLYHIGAGTTVTSNASHPVQVQIITGQPNPTPYWESRSYTVVPSSLWDNEYYSPVASSTTANADIFIYNPTGASLAVTYQDSSVPAGATITIPAGATRSFRALSGHYVPQNSSVYLTAPSNFWAIGTYDPGGADRNWGYSLIPVNTLTMEYYVGWAPGSTDLTANGSPVFVTTTQNNTTVYVDNPPADGVADATYPLNRLQILKLRSGNNNTGMHIWATSPIAVMWGQDGGYSSAGNPYIDAGYTVLPLNSSWIDVVVGSQKTASPTAISYKSGQEVIFTITTTSGFALTRLDVADTLPTGMAYKNNSTTITGPSGFTSTANPSVSGQILTWTDILGTGLASGESVIVQFTAVTNADLTVDTLTNINNSTGYYSSRSFTSSSNANVDVLYPDLTVTKTNNTAGTIALGNSFDWSLLVANTAGEAAAQFSVGQTILSDTLPSGPLYGAPVVTQTGGVTGSVTCSIASNILTCIASGGTVIIPVGQTLTVNFTVIPTAAGSLVNPTGGVCAVDPSNNISEGSAGEANNACANTVTVTSSGGT